MDYPPDKFARKSVLSNRSGRLKFKYTASQITLRGALCYMIILAALVRSIIPDLLHEQISTFGGGCSNAPPGTGKPGPNACGDMQFSVHVV